ncbi:MAG: pyruvate kinase [Acidimicrobiia bacterium]|nr:pyruvate kinase [Acidimicrobiia bacterium]
METARRTKIVATVGPASDSPNQIAALIDAGVDVFRLGLAHDDIDVVLDRTRVIREISEAKSSSAAVLIDLPGPKVRAGTFGDDGVALVDGSEIALRPGTDPSTDSVVHVSHDSLAQDLEIGDLLNLGDGRAVVQVTGLERDTARAVVINGAIMRGRPGVHIRSDRLKVTSPTPEDLRALDVAVDAGVDMVAVSFVRTARDIRALGVERAPNGPLVIAKIETEAAVHNLDTILEASDAVMVARGDLGLECSLAQIPGLQKRIIDTATRLARPVITATQMLESMTDSPQPTRAEVSDVANAVLDGTSAVMLSGETAIGHDPVRVVRTMDEILRNAEQLFDRSAWTRRIEAHDRQVDQDRNTRIENAVSAAANRAIAELSPPATVCITGSGATARAICRYRPASAVVTVTDDPRTYRQLSLVWGATPVLAASRGEGPSRVRAVLDELRRRSYLEVGQIVPVVAGSSDAALASNVLRVETVEPG